jgi:CheY-like chemotaxis protein
MSKSPHILLIDPSHRDRDHYTQRLQASCFDLVVLHAITGQAGLDLCNRRLVDCVVLELDLPDMSGFEVLLRLVPHPQHPRIPVIILTRIANQYLLEAAINNGAHAALYKSVTSEEVLSNVILKAMASCLREVHHTPALARRIPCNTR